MSSETSVTLKVETTNSGGCSLRREYGGEIWQCDESPLLQVSRVTSNSGPVPRCVYQVLTLHRSNWRLRKAKEPGVVKPEEKTVLYRNVAYVTDSKPDLQRVKLAVEGRIHRLGKIVLGTHAIVVHPYRKLVIENGYLKGECIKFLEEPPAVVLK